MGSFCPRFSFLFAGSHVLQTDVEALFGIVSAGDEPLRPFCLTPLACHQPIHSQTEQSFHSPRITVFVNRPASLHPPGPLLPFRRSSLGQKTVFRADQLQCPRISFEASGVFPLVSTRSCSVVDRRKEKVPNRQINTSASPVTRYKGVAASTATTTSSSPENHSTPLATHSPHHPTQTCDNINLTNNCQTGKAKPFNSSFVPSLGPCTFISEESIHVREGAPV